jgi:anhydro-N-acetylmuramic acid kinase
VADFRRKDIACGGQAAPLAPAFHRFLFRSDEENRVVVNIGGIANVTVLPADGKAAVLGFDTGPGNTLLDYWIERHGNAPCDDEGAWARSGSIDTVLLERMLSDEPYFRQDPPKSTGTEYFNPAWLQSFLQNEADPADVQATLAELTCITIADAIRRLPSKPRHGYICGGGAHNLYLLERLQLALPDCGLATTAALGLDPDFVEACAFAWLARERMQMRAGNIPEVTKARREAILGGVYAADQDAAAGGPKVK